ncbi:MAG: hypothetical protein OXE75_09015 [bacterium]|nr:hypothetical protein [bacterium]
MPSSSDLTGNESRRPRDLQFDWNVRVKPHHPTSGPPRRQALQITINNLLQVLRRTAHGFTNPHNFDARGLLIT